MLLWLIGCTQFEKGNTEVPWIDLTVYEQADLVNDVFSNHQPAAIDCPPNGFRVEGTQLEVQTDICNYAVIEWTTQYFVKGGTDIEALILHTGLWAPEEGNAHFAISIDGDLFWQESPPIPSNTEFFFYEAKWPEDILPGTKVQLHLHNHGANDWRVGYLQPVE